MVPSEEEEVAEGYEHQPPFPLGRQIVGEPKHHETYEVRPPLLYYFIDYAFWSALEASRREIDAAEIASRSLE